MPPAPPGRAVDALHRERLIDIEMRMRRPRALAFGILIGALLCCIPWIGTWWLLPAAGAVVAPVVSARAIERARRPELVAAATWFVAPLMIASSVAMTGGIGSPAREWFAAPAVTLGARFRRKGVAIGLLVMLALLVLATVPIDPGAVGERPDGIILTAALVLATAVFASAVVQSDRDHRLEAVVDPLTGLFNRTALQRRFEEFAQQSAVVREGSSVGFLLADLDHFKQINDEHGHATGDRVLRDVADVFRANLRAFDGAYRIGGDEIVVVLAGADEAQTARVAESLRSAVAAARPGGLRLGISIGAAVGSGPSFVLDDFYARADAALYAAKRAGRGRVELAEREAA